MQANMDKKGYTGFDNLSNFNFAFLRMKVNNAFELIRCKKCLTFLNSFPLFCNFLPQVINNNKCAL
jgi:hypothetical protein